jgi:hypothetical protein
MCCAAAVAILAAVSFEIVDRMGPPGPRAQRFYLGADWGPAEMVGYFLAATAVALLILSHFRHRGGAFRIAAVLFGFALIDDAFQYHETAGQALSQSLGLPPWGNFRAKDFGELLAWAAAGLAVGLLALRGLRDVAAGDGYLLGAFLTLFMGLAFCAIGLDMLGAAMPGKVKIVIGWAEDGGEMVFIALTASLALLCLRSDRAVFRAVQLQQGAAVAAHGPITTAASSGKTTAAVSPGRSAASRSEPVAATQSGAPPASSA